MEHKHDLASEAEAFNERIEERSSEGFIPDLRRNGRMEYFYKSFWRDPLFTDLYVGEMYRNYLRMINTHFDRPVKILDVGCGAGYFSLELAREGHDVLAIDIAEQNIQIAKETLKSNPYKKGFGSLDYKVSSIEALSNKREDYRDFDVILYSGVLHHLEDIDSALKLSNQLLVDDGIIISHEPCHENWRKEDASVVALIRSLLALTNYWYEDFNIMMPQLDANAFENLVTDIQMEYIEERDKSESGQSPHDNTFNGKQILQSLTTYFTQFEYKPSSSFIYRVLGGIRGDFEQEQKLANFLSIFDRYAVDTNLLEANYFYFCGKKCNIV